jgi:tRNA-binding EMAP/Myf-like protein
MLVVGLVLTCEPIPQKANLKVTTIDVGTETLTVVTNAPNIREGTRTIVALIGTEVEINGSPLVIEKTSVGGVMSEGMVCDSQLCGWKGGASGIAVQIPDSYELGSECPASKPRGDASATETVDLGPSIKDIKAQEKLAKKQAAKDKREAKKAAKDTSA